MDIPELTQEITRINQERQARLTAEGGRPNGAGVHRNEWADDRGRYQGLRVTPASYIYPDFFSPTSQWSRMMDDVPVVDWVIINPASGPGEVPNTDYQAQSIRAHASGALVMGYVSTAYATVDPESVKTQIKRHRDWYAVDGIFLDEAVSGWQADDAQTVYYEELYAWARAVHPGLTITTNPGVSSAPRIIAAADIVVAYENTAAVYLSTPAGDITPAHYGTEPRSKFWHLIHGVTDRAQADAVLAKARTLHVGHLYLTDDVMPNPWDRMPAGWLWDLQVQEAATLAPNKNIGTMPVPASATAPGTPGDVAYSTSYVYVCVGVNSWRRAALATW